MEQLIYDIQMGYGFVGESMLEMYSEDEGLSYEEVKAHFDSNFPHKTVEGEECWILNPDITWDQVEAEFNS